MMAKCVICHTGDTRHEATALCDACWEVAHRWDVALFRAVAQMHGYELRKVDNHDVDNTILLMPLRAYQNIMASLGAVGGCLKENRPIGAAAQAEVAMDMLRDGTTRFEGATHHTLEAVKAIAEAES